MSTPKVIPEKSMTDCEKMIEERGGLNWPVEFIVCPQHKAECFQDYKQAIVGDEDHCTICNPVENDALGG